jgi:hypothetical protein
LHHRSSSGQDDKIAVWRDNGLDVPVIADRMIVFAVAPASPAPTPICAMRFAAPEK